MRKPDQEQIDHWLVTYQNNIERKQSLCRDGFYQREDISMQSIYVAIAEDFAGLARAKLFNNEQPTIVRATFLQASKNILKSFKMAYDHLDPEYIGDISKPPDKIDPGYGEVDWTAVNEVAAMEGLNFALIGGDFDIAKLLANMYQDRKDGRKMEIIINRYVYAYKYAVLSDKQKGLLLLQQTLAEYDSKPPKKLHRINYLTLTLILRAILENNKLALESALLDHLDFYKNSVIRAEGFSGMTQGFLCDDAVALTNLAMNFGMTVEIEHDLLPKGLLLASK